MSNFNFSGLPDNNEIEIPDKPKKPNSPFGKDFAKFVPKEQIDEINNMLEEIGIAGKVDFNAFMSYIEENMKDSSGIIRLNINDLLKSLGDDVSNELFDKLGDELSEMEGLSMAISIDGVDLDGDCDGNCGNCDCEDDDNYVELSDITWIQFQPVGGVPAANHGATKLQNKFEEVFGKTGEKFSEAVKKYLMTSETYRYISSTIDAEASSAAFLALVGLAEIPVTVSIREFTDEFILAYAEPTDGKSYGVHFVFTMDDSGDEYISAPLFGNTFKMDSDGHFAGYFLKEDVELDRNYEYAMLDMSVRTMVVPIKQTLVTPGMFGTFKPVLSPVHSDSNMLLIGKLISNESPEAILLKKDAEVDLNEKEFPLYLNFGRVLGKESLQVLAPILYKCNLGESLLMNTAELEFKNQRLFISVNFGDSFN